MPVVDMRSGALAGSRLADIRLVSQDLQSLRADSRYLNELVETLEASASGASGGDSRCESGSDPRDLLQFLDLCPIEIETATGWVIHGDSADVYHFYISL